MLGEDYQLLTPADFSFTDDIPETGATLTENAAQKARFFFDKFGQACFADDSGLEVEALGGAPGVYSARYAGPEKDSGQNMDKLLFELQKHTSRRACFKTVIALADTSGIRFFEGRIDGEIIPEKRGTGGFGYDPVFVPEGYSQTFAEMEPAEKNRISHRALALSRLIHFLRNPA